MVETKSLANLSMKNGDDQDRHGVLNQKSERRVNCLPLSDRPLFVTDVRKSFIRISIKGVDKIFIFTT